MAHKEMTRYAFISHLEDYMKQLLKDPLHADTDEFLKYHGLNGPKSLSLLMKRSIPDDENSAIIIRKISIKDNGVDENGKRLKDTFTVKYCIPRKDYTKKMRNLFINLFESNIIESSPITEGAWGYGILDNDSALNKQTSFGKYALTLLCHNVESASNSEDKWSNLGVLVDFLKKYDREELRFTDDYSYAIELCKNTLDDLNVDENFIATWENQGKFKSELKRIFKDIINISYDKDRLNEDGEGGGAASCASVMQGGGDNPGAGTYDTKFGNVNRRKTMYITQEQEEYLKKMIEEEAEMNTAFGNFGYDVPIGNKNSDFYKEANDHKDIMKKSWKGNK